MMSLSTCIRSGLVTGLVCALVSVGAQAEGRSAHGPVPFAEFDKDANGLVSEQEFTATRERRMAEMAAQGKPMHGMESAPSFTDVDTDGDGQLNPDELAAAHKAHMQKMGKGRDGHHGEGGLMMQDKPKHCGMKQGDSEHCGMEQGNMKHGDKKHGQMGHGKGKGMGMKGNMPAFADFDLDGNGMISEQEFSEGHSMRMSEMAAEGRKMQHMCDESAFAKIDADADGAISESEFAAHQADHQSKMKQDHHKQDHHKQDHHKQDHHKQDHHKQE